MSESILQARQESEAATSEMLVDMPAAGGETEADGTTGLASSSSIPMGGIVVYCVCRSIATGAMMLGPLVPLVAHEVFPVVGFSAWVVVHETPEYFLFLRYLPIIVVWLSEER